MSKDSSRPREFTGRHMLIVVCAFFGVIIAVNGALAYFANRTWTGLLARNGYVASQDYNHVLADARRQAELGWRSSLDAGRDGLAFRIAGADGAPLPGLTVQAFIGRPTTEREDRNVLMQAADAGRYLGDVLLAPGRWVVRVEASDPAGRHYRRIFDLDIPAGR